MLPRLYNSSPLIHDQSRNGYGFFNHCTRCDVTEERNGEYYAEIEIAPDDRLIHTIAPGMLIKAKANHKDAPQMFIIENIEIDKSGAAKITAQHIKKCIFSNVSRPATWATRSYVAEGAAHNVIEHICKNVRLFKGILTDISCIGLPTDVRQMETDFSVPQTLYDVFYGEGGFLDTFGGEFYFDNYNCVIYDKRGSDTDKVIRYGAEISDFVQSITAAENYDTVYGFAKYVDSNKNIYTFETNVIPTSTASKGIFFQNIIAKDYSSHFTFLTENGVNVVRIKTGSTVSTYDITSEEGKNAIVNKLEYLVRKYIAAKGSKLTEPSVNIRVTKNPDLNNLQDIGMCDRVKVICNELGLSITVKVVKTVYDSLLERYKEIELGERKISLADYLRKTNRRNR